MFPFLAVLLCTIGALVLILVVSVVHSHASAKRDIAVEVTERIEQAKEKSDILESVSEELLARRERVKQEIERRQRELANIEDHIDRLREEMDGLRAKAKAIETSSERDENAKREHELKIEAIKSEIDKKKQELAEKIREQKQRKPAFSIIPYSGNNGTSRRPVYIECRSDGVVIQPEGVAISIQDLRPPHGPGNPLDAALRILRNTYQQRDATYGISTPPYPLLVVRPDGIHTYALARSAMAGWDDQFGYELVEDDMELAFPAGVPSLAAELEKALAIAKRRQESLLASSPARFGRSATEWDDEEAPLSGDAPAANRGRTGNGSQWGDESETANGAISEGESSRWRMVQELQPGQVVAAAPSPNSLPAGGHSRSTGTPGAQPANPSAPNGQALNSLSLGTASGGNLAGEYQTVAGQAPTRLTGLPQTVGSGVSSSQFTSGMSNPSDLAASNPLHGNTNTPTLAAGSAGNASGGGNAANGATATGNTASSQGSSAAGGSAGGTAASGAAASAGNASASQSSNASNAMSAGRANAFSSGSAGAAAGAGATSSSLDEVEESRQIPLPTPNGSSASGKDAAQGMPSNARHAKESKSDSDTKPISISAGKGWAVSRAEGKATPVSRPIRIVVLADRWLIRDEDHNSKFDAEILLETGPAQAGKELEQAIRQRVDSWGLSLPGGYWAPTVTMESASDAQQSVQRLQRLLEGSGVDVRVIPLQAPTRKSK
jgi:uncharacterized protein YoxC